MTMSLTIPILDIVSNNPLLLRRNKTFVTGVDDGVDVSRHFSEGVIAFLACSFFQTGKEDKHRSKPICVSR